MTGQSPTNLPANIRIAHHHYHPQYHEICQNIASACLPFHLSKVTIVGPRPARKPYTLEQYSVSISNTKALNEVYEQLCMAFSESPPIENAHISVQIQMQSFACPVPQNQFYRYAPNLQFVNEQAYMVLNTSLAESSSQRHRRTLDGRLYCRTRGYISKRKIEHKLGTGTYNHISLWQNVTDKNKIYVGATGFACTARSEEFRYGFQFGQFFNSMVRCHYKTNTTKYTRLMKLASYDLNHWMNHIYRAQKREDHLKKWLFTYQIMLQLNHHRMCGQILHLDLKCSNIVVFNHPEYCHAKIIDYGFAKRTLELPKTHERGTITYAAPELLNGSAIKSSAGHRLAADAYSLGILMVNLFTDGLPHYDKANTFEEIQSRLSKTSTPKALDELILGLCQPEPMRRTSILAALTQLSAMISSNSPEYIFLMKQHSLYLKQMHQETLELLKNRDELNKSCKLFFDYLQRISIDHMFLTFETLKKLHYQLIASKQLIYLYQNYYDANTRIEDTLLLGTICQQLNDSLRPRYCMESLFGTIDDAFEYYIFAKTVQN